MEKRAVLQWLGALLLCAGALMFAINWFKDWFSGVHLPTIVLVLLSAAVLTFAIGWFRHKHPSFRIPSWVTKTVVFSILFALFVAATYRGFFGAMNQAIGGVTHQFGSDAGLPSSVINQRPSMAVNHQAPSNIPCLQRGIDGEPILTNVKPGDRTYVVKGGNTRGGLLMSGERINVTRKAVNIVD